MKKFLGVLLAVLMIMSLAACGQTETTVAEEAKAEVTSASRPYEGVTLRFVADNHSWTTAMESVIAEFEEETGAVVEVEGYSEENLLSKLNVELAAGSKSIDILMLRPPLDAGTFIANGWLENLDAYSPQYASSVYAFAI